jgi:hypothetical protein
MGDKNIDGFDGETSRKKKNLECPQVDDKQT